MAVHSKSESTQAPNSCRDEVLKIGVQIAEGLDAAHLQGVIHRDIKPANIMLLDRGEAVKITDFGLARVELDLAEMTSADQVVGTPAYMSPEQVRGETLDARSDLFSLGCVFFAMVAGRSPFLGRHILEIGRKITEEAPPPLHLIDPAVPRPLSDLVARLLQKAPDDRPKAAGEVAAELRHVLEDTDLEIGIGTTAAARPSKQSATQGEPPAPEFAVGRCGGCCAIGRAGCRPTRAPGSHDRAFDRQGDHPPPAGADRPGRQSRTRPRGRFPDLATSARVRLAPENHHPADRAGHLLRVRSD